MVINEQNSLKNQSPMIRCPVCGTQLSIRIAKGRKSGKPFLMLICPQDGRHFRGFINHRLFVEKLIQNLENLQDIKY